MYLFDCGRGEVHGGQFGGLVSVDAQVGAAELREVDVHKTVRVLAQHVLAVVATLLRFDGVAQ